MISRFFKHQESTLEKKKHQWNDCTRDIICLLDADLHFSDLNKAGEVFWGVRKEQVCGAPFSAVVGNDLSRRLSQAVRQGEKQFRAVLKNRDGQKSDVMVFLSDNASEDEGSSEKWVCSFQNVSAQVCLEKALQEKTAALETAVRQSELGCLAGKVCHDLNNILSGIATYPDVLMLDADLDQKTLQGLEMIKDSGRKASAIVSDLLTISKGLTAEMELLNLNTVIERYLHSREFTGILQASPGVVVDMDLEPELLDMKGSYFHIEKSLKVLILNAVQEVAENSGGHVEIRTENYLLDADKTENGSRGSGSGEYVSLIVQDNGPGMEEKIRHRIFEPFFATKHLQKKGTGLGFTMVRHMAAIHGGDILVSSDDTGCRFELLFPADRENFFQMAGNLELEGIRGNGERILVVEGALDQQHTALHILDILGYRAEGVKSAAAARAYLRNNPADLVILNPAVPVDGESADLCIREIRPGQKIIPVCAASGSDPADRAVVSADCFVKKPYTVMDMGIAIKEELER